MKKGSWKTTAAGILSICGGVTSVVFGIINHGLSEALIMTGITAIVTGIGLILAKDGDVTGGSTSNGMTIK